MSGMGIHRPSSGRSATLTPYYSDGAVTLYLGDCMDILPSLDRVDHVITDPPYSEHVHGKQWVAHAMTDNRPRYKTVAEREHKELGFEHLSEALRTDIAREAQRLAQRWVLVFSDIEGVPEWRDGLKAQGLDYVRTCIWVKPDAAPQFSGDRPANAAECIVVAHPFGKKRWNGGGSRGVFTYGINDFGRVGRFHPSPKPEPLMSELVSLFTDSGDLILDPFMGSGTTLVAAKRLGRRAIGIEREERYCEVAARRLSQGALALFGSDESIPAVDGTLELSQE